MDGCLHVVSLDSHQRHTLPAHTKPVSVVRCGGGRVVSGGYDGTVVVHRMTDLERERTITVHSGSRVTSLALDCVSGNSLVTESHFQFQSWPLFRGFTLCWYRGAEAGGTYGRDNLTIALYRTIYAAGGTGTYGA